MTNIQKTNQKIYKKLKQKIENIHHEIKTDIKPEKTPILEKTNRKNRNTILKSKSLTLNGIKTFTLIIVFF